MTTDQPASDRDAHADADERVPRTGIDRVIFQVEAAVSVLLLGGLVVAGLLPIIFRGNQAVNTSWVTPFTHHMVLWIALFGAAVATRDQKHITVDALGQFLKPRKRALMKTATDVLSAIVCSFVTYLCCRFVGQEWPSATGVEFWGIPERFLQLVLPVGFAVISCRFLTSAWQNFATFRKTAAGSPPEPAADATD